jgi:hypothetical protein
MQNIGKDFFMRSPNDPNYREGIFESNDPIENAIQQIRMTLLTKPGEVLGEDIGFNSEKYLFEFEFADLSGMENEANAQISEYVLFSRPYNIKVDALHLSNLSDVYKVGLGLDVKIDGISAFATLFDI